MTKQILNLTFAGIMGIVFVGTASAAPTVKKLGSSNLLRTSGVTQSDNASAARASTVRLKSSGIAKAAVSTPKSESVGALTSANSARLSLGKYLNSSNVVKPTSNQMSASVASVQEVTDLQGRVSNIESDVDTVKQDVETLKSAKQDKISVGPGLEINENGVISLASGNGINVDEETGEVIADVKIPVGGAGSEATSFVEMWVE